MLYVLLILVVVLALVCGVQFAFIKCMRADYKAEVASLKYDRVMLERKLMALLKENNEQAQRLTKLGSIKEGLEND